MFGGSCIAIGSDICEKSGSSEMICLLEVAEFGNSLAIDRVFITHILLTP